MASKIKKKLLLSVVGIKQEKKHIHCFFVGLFSFCTISIFASFISTSDCVSFFLPRKQLFTDKAAQLRGTNKYSPLYFKQLQFILPQHSVVLLLAVSES